MEVQPPSSSEGEERSEDESGKKEEGGDNVNVPGRVKDAVDSYVK